MNKNDFRLVPRPDFLPVFRCNVSAFYFIKFKSNLISSNWPEFQVRGQIWRALRHVAANCNLWRVLQPSTGISCVAVFEALTSHSYCYHAAT